MVKISMGKHNKLQLSRRAAMLIQFLFKPASFRPQGRIHKHVVITILQQVTVAAQAVEGYGEYFSHWLSLSY